ncbi:MAG: Fe-S cluster assembly protein SufD [Acidobacteria bacterium]|nr:Fe-S cluster assembly protein SufD [Acidobacteriota bacterium]
MTQLSAALDTLAREQTAPMVGWLAELRRAGRLKFDREGLPTPKMESWRGTNVTPLGKISFVAASPADAPTHVLANLGLGGLRFVFSGGQLIATEGGTPAGLWAGTFPDALQHFGDRMRDWVTGDEAEVGAFEALNQAFLGSGAVIVVEEGAVIEAPIEIVYALGPQASEAIQQPRTLIVAAANSRVQVIETFVSEGRTPTLTNAVTRTLIGENASVEHVRLQIEGPQAWHVSTVVSRQDRSSRYTAHHINLGARLARHNTLAVLDGEGAHCVLNGLYLVSGDQHVDNNTVLDHAKPHCDSRELFKGILAGKAHSIFTGRIIVRPDAQKTDAKQSNPNLLLSPTALAQTRPQLEIYADDVRCTHGATVGRMDDDAIFYMRARGLSETAARNMLIHAVAAEVLDAIDVPRLRDALKAEVSARLERLGT